MKWSIILGQIVTSKAVVDKIRLPGKYYNTVDSGLREMEQWSNTFKGLELDKPQTWVQTGLRVMRRISEPEEEIEKPKKSLIFRFIEKMGYVRLDNLNSIRFYHDFIRNYYKESEVVIEGEQGILRRIVLEGCEDDFYFYELVKSESSEVEIDAVPFLPDFEDFRERREAINEVIASLYWSDRQIIKLDLRSDIIEYADFKPLSREYEGVLTTLYEDLKVYKEKGIRRSILFQGPPGTGKSTLAFNLAQKLSGRTIVISHKFLQWVNDPQWEYVISLLQPEMIVVDDIDRISDDLKRRLHLFEDHYCPVPLILMTSNHYDWLPDAFKRPGRIDEIIEMQNPSRKIRYEVIRAIARQEGVAVPEEKMAILDEIHEDYPGAYIVELLRRVKGQGWDYSIPPYDLTFAKLDKATKARWNGEPEPEPEPQAAINGELDPMRLQIEDLVEEA